jgi:hypothetical protein
VRLRRFGIAALLLDLIVVAATAPAQVAVTAVPGIEDATYCDWDAGSTGVCGA